MRHLKALAWMVSALIYSGQLSLPAREPYVPSRAEKAQSVERRWQRFLGCGTDSGGAIVCALGVCGVKWVEVAPPVSGTRHHGLVESKTA